MTLAGGALLQILLKKDIQKVIFKIMNFQNQ
jgi:hypothetical protein